MSVAFDRSLRSFTADGHMVVEESRVSRACISEYLGAEIPDFQALGLDANRVYRLLRDPGELQNAADSLTSKPVLLKHAAISAEAPRKELIAGTTGNVTYEHPFLVSRPLTLWDASAIELVKSNAQRELSAGYRYRADMTPGTYEGEPFDGVMRELAFQHVALVSEGRVPGAVVADQQIPEEFRAMKNRTAAAVAKTIAPYLAPDADRKTLALALDAAVGSTEPSLDEEIEAEAEANGYFQNAKDAWEKLSAADKLKARDSWHKARDSKRAKDSGEVDHRKDFEQGANDSTDAVRRQMRDAYRAREAVKPIVGIIALDAAGMDSAPAIYRFALKQAGIKDADTIHESALATLLDVVKSRKPAAIAFDSSSSANYIPLTDIATVARVWPARGGRRPA